MKLVKKESFLLRAEDEEIEKSVKYDQCVRKESARKWGEPDIDVVNHYYSYFACTCSTEDKKYWNQRLHDYMPEFDPEKHASLVSQLCAEITHGFDGSVCGIDMDMWFGISVQGTVWLDDDYTEHESYNIYMQCDDVTLGLMAVVDILKTIMEQE